MDYFKLNFNFVQELETSQVLFIWIVIYIQMSLQQCIEMPFTILSSVVFDNELTYPVQSVHLITFFAILSGKSWPAGATVTSMLILTSTSIKAGPSYTLVNI